MKNEVSKGVLDTKYTKERKKRMEFIFRFKTRTGLLENAIKKYLGKFENLNILDLGSAEGLTLVELDKSLPKNDIIGIEYNQDLISRAPTLPANIKLIQGDVCRLESEFEDNFFDVVSALALLEHLSRPEDCMKEVSRILRPGGIFIATSPSPFWDSLSSKLGLLKEDSHEIKISKKVIKKLAKQAGLEMIEFKRFMWAPISILPYFNIKVSPSVSLIIDNLISKIFIFNWLFVNQAFILKKK